MKKAENYFKFLNKKKKHKEKKKKLGKKAARRVLAPINPALPIFKVIDPYCGYQPDYTLYSTFKTHATINAHIQLSATELALNCGFVSRFFKKLRGRLC